MKRLLTHGTMLTLFVLFAACYPQGPEYIEDLDLVVTHHDASFDFKTLGTYALPDEVVKLTGNVTEGDEVEFVDPVYANPILASIRENMNALGWTEVDKGDADVLILPMATSSTYAFWYYDWWYWDWWYPYDWWGWYYPYPIYGGAYTTGSLFIQMTYPDGTSAADNIPVIWSGIFNGLLEGGTANINDRIETSIDQAFDQSPYLEQ